MKFVYSDGGRREAGFKGNTGDCVTRSIAIATGKPYIEVYNELYTLTGDTPRTGVRKTAIKRYLTSLGWEWTPTMGIGTGCHVHLRENELPSGRLIVSCSRHITCVIDGIIYDAYDPSRHGTRCVYGYWRKP